MSSPERPPTTNPAARVAVFEHAMRAFDELHDLGKRPTYYTMTYQPFEHRQAAATPAINFYGMRQSWWQNPANRWKWITYAQPVAVADPQSFRALSDEPESRADSVGHYQQITLNGILRFLLSDAAAHERLPLGLRALDRASFNLTSGRKSTHMGQLIHAYQEGTTGFSSLAELYQAATAQGSASPQDLQAFKQSVSVRLEKSIRQNPIADTVAEDLETVIGGGLFEPQVFNNVESMLHPRIATQLVAELGYKDLFAQISPQGRRNMAGLLLQGVLSHFALEDRHTENLDKIRQALFGDDQRTSVFPMRDLLVLSNAITASLNERRGPAEQQELLDVSGQAVTIFLGCGEAFFRCLAITAKTPEHVVENRNYAELFDALMEPYYRAFIRTRFISASDIAARYPDARGKLAVELQAAANQRGYLAASEHYRRAKEAYGKNITQQPHRPGHGIIS